MQTILGAQGQIGAELARVLHRDGVTDLRLVSRNPAHVNDSDTLAAADLTDAAQTRAAVAGSDTVYFTAGLPANTALWQAQFPLMLRNALDAARVAGARFAYFDNTYMYAQDDAPKTEDAPFVPFGPKAAVRAAMAESVLAEVARGEIPVLIARAPEFYGPGRTQSFTNSLVIDRLRAGRRALVPVRDDTRRTLIWTPDASRALALLGRTDDAYGKTWHLPVDTARLTYRQLVTLAADVFERRASSTVVPAWVFRALGAVSPGAREIVELLPRYAHDTVIDATKFGTRFPDFAVTTFAQGLAALRGERDR